MKSNISETQTSYDRVAKTYADQFYNEIDRKPFDQKMLGWLVDRTAALGPVCDFGCGPGQVAAYMQRLGGQVMGMDLSPEMINQAKRLFPSIHFVVDNLLTCAAFESNSLGGIAAFYTYIHIHRDELLTAFKSAHRVLKPGGTLLLTFHIGTETVHLEDWWEKEVNLDFYFFEPAEIKPLVTEAGFQITESIERDPYPDVEFPSRRAYLFAQKPSI